MQFNNIKDLSVIRGQRRRNPFTSIEAGIRILTTSGHELDAQHCLLMVISGEGQNNRHFALEPAGSLPRQIPSDIMPSGLDDKQPSWSDQ